MNPKLPALALSLFALGGCSSNKSELHGTYAPSLDGKTYLVILNNNGGNCGLLQVDGKTWTHSIGQIGEVQPGAHTIACGTDISITIKPGVVYRFNYWGQ